MFYSVVADRATRESPSEAEEVASAHRVTQEQRDLTAAVRDWAARAEPRKALRRLCTEFDRNPGVDDRRVQAARHRDQCELSSMAIKCSSCGHSGRAAKDPSVVSMPVGQIVGSMNEVRPVAEVMSELLSDYEQTLTRLDKTR